MITRTRDFRATIWQMTLIGLRHLNGRRLRTVLTTLSIVFGVALIFAINLVLPSLMEAFKQSVSAVTGADVSITSVSGESFAPDPVLARVAGVQHVQAVTGILHRQFSLPKHTAADPFGSVEQIDLIGVDPASIERVHPFTMSEGRFLQPGDSGKAVLPAGIADLAPQLKVGTTFSLVTADGLKSFTVVGLLAEQGSLSAPEVLITLPDAQAALDQPGLINRVEVSVSAGANQKAVAANIQHVLGDGYVLNAGSNASDVLAAAKISFAMFDLFGALALFLGAFLIFNTFRTVVIERRHDLAMLRAIGATRRQITLMILLESLMQGVLGMFIGLIVGFGLAGGLAIIMNSVFSKYLNRGVLALQLNASAVLIAAGLGLLTSLIAGYWPARTAGRMSPLEALRPATEANVRHAARWSLIAGGIIIALAVIMFLSSSTGAIGGAVLFLIGMVIAAPGLVIPAARLFSPLLTLWFAREGDLARGNMVRQPGRAAITGSTLMIGVATFVLMAAVVTGIVSLFRTLTVGSFSSDLLVLPQSVAVYNNVIGADAALANRVRALPEVETVGSLRYASTETGGTALQVMGIDPHDYPKVVSLDFNQGQPQAAFAALGSGRNAILTPLASFALGLDLGSDMVIQTAEGPQTYHIVGVAQDVLTAKINAIFISQANLATDFHKTEDVMLMINLRPGADKAAALADVNHILTDYPQFTAHLSQEYRDDMINTTRSTANLFYAVAFLILIPAGFGLLNTLTINVMERTREIGVVRAVGGSRSQVRRMVTGEALLLGTFGAAMGVLTGVAISYGVIAAFGTIGWKMPYPFPLMGIIAGLIVGVILALFSSILPARNAAKIDIIRALQYE
jgi:putative ABC transport system permease protein